MALGTGANWLNGVVETHAIFNIVINSNALIQEPPLPEHVLYSSHGHSAQWDFRRKPDFSRVVTSLLSTCPFNNKWYIMKINS